ncbi:RGS domain-containing protein [Dichotomocladium elegans]|nr:RGS domain-containing protein [Dichotomocladium elegans]
MATASSALLQHPSDTDLSIPAPTDTDLPVKTQKSIAKPRRISLPPPVTFDSQCSGKTPWTLAMLSDRTSSSYFHDDLSTSVILARNQAAAVDRDQLQLLLHSPPLGFEAHASYKDRTAKSSQKLDRFFGAQAPHDTCIKEIRKEGLKAMLQSKTPLCYFLYHLLKEYSSENLFFFIEIEQYEAFDYASVVQQFATAQHICTMYLDHDSQFEVNVDDKVRRTVIDALRNKQMQGCFAVAKRAVYDLLESSYKRFLRADIFDLMVHDCGELTTHYDETSRRAAPQLLLQYLEQQYAIIYTNPHTDQAALLSASHQSSRRRHELTRSMIQAFCRTKLDVQIEYSSSYEPSRTQEHSRAVTSFDFLCSRRKQ